MNGMSNLLDLRSMFVDILDIDKGDGACALSLLDEVINAEQLRTPQLPTAESLEDIPQVYSIAEAIEYFAEQFYTEMTFDEIHDLAVELLEQRIIQLTQLLNERDNG